MAIAETAKLVSSLELNTKQFDAGIRRAGGSLSKLSGSIAKSRAVAVGLGVGLERVAEKGISALGNAIGDGIQGAQELEKAQAQTAAVIKSTGGAAGVTADQVRALAEAQESVTTVDDKTIQSGENLLLTFTNIGKTVFPGATKAAVNMAVAFNKGDAATADIDSAAIQLGKALNDPAKGFTALSRAGVSFNDQQKAILKGTNALNKEQVKHYQNLKKTDKAAAERYKKGILANNLLTSQKLILAELNKEFGEAGKAAGTGFTADINRANDAIDDAKVAIAQGLIPAVGEVARELTTTLNDPQVQSGLKELGKGIGEAVKGIVAFAKTVPWETIASSLQAAAGFAKDLLNAFLGLPAWVQTAVITGWGLNKITGGALGDIVSSLASGLIKGVLGINAGVVNVNAATVSGAGGLPGAGAAGAGGAGVVATALGPVGWAAAGAAIASKFIADVTNSEFAQKGISVNFEAPGSGFFGIPSALNNIAEGLKLLQSNNQPTGLGKGADDTALSRDLSSKLTDLDKGTGDVHSAITDLQGKTSDDLGTLNTSTVTGLQGATSAVQVGALTQAGATRTGAASVVNAIYANRPIIDVAVNIAATTVEKTVQVNERYGPVGGDRNLDSRNQKNAGTF